MPHNQPTTPQIRQQTKNIMQAQTKLKFSKYAKAFVEKYQIQRFLGMSKFDPNQFSQQERRDFENFKKQQTQKRLNKHYVKRKANDSAPRPKPPRTSMTQQERERQREMTSQSVAKNYHLRKTLREKALSFGLNVPHMKDCTTLAILRDILLRKITDPELALLEETINQEFAGHIRKEPADGGGRKPGPMKSNNDKSDNKDDQQVPQITPHLKLFLDNHPDIPRVHKLCQLSPEHQSMYKSFTRAQNIEFYRARDRARDAAHREERNAVSIPDP